MENFDESEGVNGGNSIAADLESKKSASGSKSHVPANGNAEKSLFQMNSAVVATYAVTALYSTSFFLQTNILPYIVTEIKISNVQYGYGQTLFGIVQLIGGPIFGQLCDIRGVRTGLLLGFASTSLCYAVTFLCNDYSTFLLSRVVCVFMHGFQAAQTSLSGVTKEGKERTAAFGHLGVMFGIGFVTGPLLAGISSKFLGIRFPLLLATGLGLLAMVLTYRYIPNSRKVSGGGEAPSFDLRSYHRVLQYPNVIWLLAIRNVAMSPMFLISSILGLYLVEEYQVTPMQNSMLSTYVGVSIALMNGVGVAWLRNRYSELLLLKVAAATLLVTYGCYTVFYEFWHLFIFVGGGAVGMCLVANIIDNQITSIVPGAEHGTLLGCSHFLNALFRGVTPVISGYMLDKIGFWSFGVAGVFLEVISFWLVVQTSLQTISVTD